MPFHMKICIVFQAMKSLLSLGCKRASICAFLCILGYWAQGQAPVVWINFVSHNEPGDNLHQPMHFYPARNKVVELAELILSKKAAWNLQTCDGFALGAFQLEGVENNVFRSLASFPFLEHIEIDPRNKNLTNIADLYGLLDTLGAKPTQTLGGFTYSPIPDWYQYQDTIQGINRPWVLWKCQLMWGAGSPGHQNDFYDYGIWKPDSTTTSSFIIHNPARTIWYTGHGCQPVGGLDSLEDIALILQPLRAFVDSLQNGLLPADKFYGYSITINQREFGPLLFDKVARICDTLNAWGPSRVRWATLTQRLSAFETWQIESGLAYSQWSCGQTGTTSFQDVPPLQDYTLVTGHSAGIYEIRFTDASQQHVVILSDVLGRELQVHSGKENLLLDLRSFPTGTYFLKVNHSPCSHLYNPK